MITEKSFYRYFFACKYDIQPKVKKRKRKISFQLYSVRLKDENQYSFFFESFFIKKKKNFQFFWINHSDSIRFHWILIKCSKKKTILTHLVIICESFCNSVFLFVACFNITRSKEYKLKQTQKEYSGKTKQRKTLFHKHHHI